MWIYHIKSVLCHFAEYHISDIDADIEQTFLLVSRTKCKMDNYEEILGASMKTK